MYPSLLGHVGCSFHLFSRLANGHVVASAYSAVPSTPGNFFCVLFREDGYRRDRKVEGKQ